MSTIAERFLEVGKKYNKNMSEFAASINVTPAYMTKLKKFPEDCTPSTALIHFVCQKYRVSEKWMLTGEGEMEAAVSRQEQIAAFFGEVECDNSFKEKFIYTLSQLDEKEWSALEHFAQKLSDQIIGI